MSFPFPFPFPAPFLLFTRNPDLPSTSASASSSSTPISNVCRIASARSVSRRGRLPSTTSTTPTAGGKSFDSAGNCHWSRIDSGTSPAALRPLCSCSSPSSCSPESSCLSESSSRGVRGERDCADDDDDDGDASASGRARDGPAAFDRDCDCEWDDESCGDVGGGPPRSEGSIVPPPGPPDSDPPRSEPPLWSSIHGKKLPHCVAVPSYPIDLRNLSPSSSPSSSPGVRGAAFCCICACTCASRWESLGGLWPGGPKWARICCRVLKPSRGFGWIASSVDGNGNNGWDWDWEGDVDADADADAEDGAGCASKSARSAVKSKLCCESVRAELGGGWGLGGSGSA